MDEGVDPTSMCQSLVNKVAQSEQLMAVTDPEILVLFEDWLEELEREVIVYVNAHPSADTKELAQNLGVSEAGIRFLMTKLKKEQKI